MKGKSIFDASIASAIDYESNRCSICKFYHSDPGGVDGKCYVNPPDINGNRPKVHGANYVCRHAIRTKSSVEFIRSQTEKR